MELTRDLPQFDADLRVFVEKRAATAAKTCASASRVLQNFRDARRVVCILLLRAAFANLAPNLHQTRAIFDVDLRVFVKNAQRPLQKLVRVRRESCKMFFDTQRMICISFCARRLQIWRRICTKIARSSLNFSTLTCAFSWKNAQRPLQKPARVRRVSCKIFVTHDAWFAFYFCARRLQI